MSDLRRIIKVQLHIPQLPSGKDRNPRGWFAHNFVTFVDAGGSPFAEFDGLAYYKDSIDGLGGVLPFDHLRGRVFQPSYFYDPSFPQVQVFRGGSHEVARRFRAGQAVNAIVNQRHLPYPWGAATGLNSNSYCTTLLRVMGLPDAIVPHGWPSPQSGRYLLSEQEMNKIAAQYLSSGVGGVFV